MSFRYCKLKHLNSDLFDSGKYITYALFASLNPHCQIGRSLVRMPATIEAEGTTRALFIYIAEARRAQNAQLRHCIL
ncbi:hypothetical protein LMG28614_01368 [Paraburkholderia ultramafica]|uniref:Uncharacterized protein n=1 Tax=Paraburkholderia ultramafica TaxID=1544867 RepID=A0A6S7AZJ7_9BURK|nr:hypothetical protein [Paraburkholderia ultramafica]CAB3782099.1 hypothetical protein LMG28614_01368 [Paraburkholderia ultramafica]